MTDARRRQFRTFTEGYAGLRTLSEAVRGSGLEHSLLELVKMRASQVNGCAFCMDMHTKDARKAGETEQRIYGLTAWRETPFYTDRERAALALTEAVTLVAGGVPQSVLDEAAEQFTPEEMGKLVFAIVEINSWNRLAITTGSPVPGSYEPKD